MRRSLIFVLFLAALNAYAQEQPDSNTVMKRILDRLENLEKENKEMAQDLRALRAELAQSRSAVAAPNNEPNKPDQASLNDRLTIEESRTAEQAQTKVEAAHKLPIQLTGMLLFNAFANSAETAPPSPGQYSLLTGPERDGATLRQTLLGLSFQGPNLPGNGRINGFLSMDFFGGSSTPGYAWLRLRRAGVSLDWKNRSVFVGQDKPLISPYQPDSLAEVGVPPLAGAGNLWLWLPQARYEERISLGNNTGLKGQVAVLQTDETYQTVSPSIASSLSQARPALEGRFEFWHKLDETRRFAFAPGFHLSTTRVAGTSVASRIGSLDWNVVPFSKLQLSGTLFTGQNVAALGALGNGFAIAPLGIGSLVSVKPVDSTGGWSQLSIPFTSRFTFNLFSGLENDNASFLTAADIVHNWTYAGNLMLHLGSNVIVSAEALQMRTRSAAGLERLQNHYDLALGYLF